MTRLAVRFGMDNKLILFIHRGCDGGLKSRHGRSAMLPNHETNRDRLARRHICRQGIQRNDGPTSRKRRDGKHKGH
jgi:hypothetical protein